MNSRFSRLSKVLIVGFLALISATTLSAEGMKKHPLTKKFIDVTGIVKDNQGELLPGVNIRVRGTGTGTVTDIDGKYSIKVPDEESSLLFSYIGYEQEVLKVKPHMDVVMKESMKSLGEVVVSTQKRTQSSIDVPATVSAMTGKSLKNLDVRQFDEVAAYVPGVQIQIQSPNNPGYVIRGVTSDEGASYSQPRVSLFMDGVSISRSRASVVQLYDMERIEVVKGPQGTLFGRGAEIGAIHVIRKKPVDYNCGEISIGYGTYNNRNAEGFINLPFLKGKMADRFAFSYEARDGFIKNKAGGRLNGKKAIALRNSLRLFANDNTTFDLTGDYQYDDYPGTSFRTKNPAYGSTNPYDDANMEQGKDLYIKRHVGGVSFNGNHVFNDKWELSSITGFRAFKSDESFDADGTPAYLLWCEEEERGTQFSQELRMNYNNGGRFSGFFGTSYFYENSQQKVIARTNMQELYPAYLYSKFADAAKPQIETIENLLSSVGPSLPTQGQAVVSALQSIISGLKPAWFPESYDLTDAGGSPSKVTNTPDFYGDINSAMQANLGMSFGDLINWAKSLGASGDAIATQLTALQAGLQGFSNLPLSSYHEENSTNYGTNQAAEFFADGTYKIYKNLSLTLGVRGTYEHQKTGYKSLTEADPVFGVIMYEPTANGKVNISKDYYSWVGRCVLNYMFKRNNAYASISRGRRPGVIYFNNSPDDVSRLKPEIIVSYELGLKGLLMNGKIRYDLASYYYDWSHFQTNRFDGSTNKFIADDAGKAHSFGIEAGLSYSPVKVLNVFGNYSYIDGKFNNKDEHGVRQEYAGNRFRLTPKNSFTLGANIKVPLNKKSEVYLVPTYSYKSKVFFEDSNEPYLTQDGYGLVNFNAGFKYRPGDIYYEFGVYGKNVFDTRYLIDAGNTGRLIGYPTYVAGSKSLFGVRVKMGF